MSRRLQPSHVARRGCRFDRQAARSIQHPRPRDKVCPDLIGRPGRATQLLAGPSEVRNQSAFQVRSSRPGRARADWMIFARKRSARILLHRLMQSRPGFGRRGEQLNLPALVPPKIRIHPCRSCRSSANFQARISIRGAGHLDPDQEFSDLSKSGRHKNQITQSVRRHVWVGSVNRYRVEQEASPAMSAMPRKRKQAQSISVDTPLRVDGDALDVISSQ